MAAETPAIDSSAERLERTGRRNRNNRRSRRDREDIPSNELNRPFIPNNELNAPLDNLNVEPVLTAQPTINLEPSVMHEENVDITVDPFDSSVKKVSSNEISGNADENNLAAMSLKEKAANKKPVSKRTSVNDTVENVAQNTAFIDEHAVVDEATSLKDNELAIKTDIKRPSRSRKPKVEMHAIDLTSVGLQLVETKSSALNIEVNAEPVKSTMPRKAAWQQKSNENIDTEPLMLVETLNK